MTQTSWPPGKPVPVTVEISLNGVSGFARFFQDLPQGFSVEPVNSAGADFYWENNQVNLVWLKLPAVNVVKIQYLVTADESLGGSFRMGGRFDYIVNGNDRSSSETIPFLITLDRRAGIEDVEMLPGDTVRSEQRKEEEKEEVVTEVQPQIVYRVQVAISSQSLTRAELEGRIGCELRYDITILKAGTMYKYQSGSFGKYTEAERYLEELRDCGVKDSFIVAYKGDEQIAVETAKAMEK